jgi:hypothetical protein
MDPTLWEMNGTSLVSITDLATLPNGKVDGAEVARAGEEPDCDLASDVVLQQEAHRLRWTFLLPRQ